MSEKGSGPGFKTGFILGSIVGGALGYLAASADLAEPESEAGLVSDVKRFLRRFRSILQRAFEEGRDAAKQSRAGSRVQVDDLDLDDPRI